MTLAVAALIVAASGAGCSAPGSADRPTTSPDAPISAAPGSTSPGQITLPTAAPITPTADAGIPSGIPAAAAAPEPTPGIYTAPTQVARAWMQQFCQTDYAEPINANVTRAGIYATPAATAADTAHGDTADTYRQMREQALSTRCDHVEAAVNPDAPARPDAVYVQVSATSTQLAGGQPFQTLPVDSTRRVVRGADERWLVDVAVDAG